ncbi:MAG: hypothetical protein IKQ39_04190 [Oscillospiraceae bacterium]|nr:hypothetical protein [Oscillospiraceae bacterium]
MKRITALFAVFAVLLTAVSCGKKQDSQAESTAAEPSAESSEDAAQKPAEPIVLTNHMTETEKAFTEKHALTLLDNPQDAVHKISVMKSSVPPEEQLHYLEECKKNGLVSQEEYEKLRAEAEAARDAGEQVEFISCVLIDGCYYSGIHPPDDYDGGKLSIIEAVMETDENGEPVDRSEYREFDTAEDYFDSLGTGSLKQQAQLVFAAFRDKNYTELPEGFIDFENPPEGLWEDPFDDKRDLWEFDRDAVEKIKDSIDEYSIYDEEMGIEFLVQVTLPPDYDPEQTYPMMLLTDGVWRFGDVPAMRRCMEKGEAAPVLLATLGYCYHIDGTNEYYRFTHLVQKRDMLLDFITDNLMPYLGEQYHIDYADSTLYGHSDGGVFAHNALFNSDRYENQPFGRYIIGSPAFFGLYDEDFDDLRADEAMNDYGYFDRNERLDKRVWLTGGSQEDPDYEQLYRGHDTTLEGLAHLRDRIEAHHGEYVYRLYESHHYQYIPDLLKEYLIVEYPA